MARFFCLFFLFLRIVSFCADFDYAVIGTSPISLFEALYKQAEGNRVVILEAASECGGAWKSITACGIEHVDMGCHEIGSTAELNRFLEVYGGCQITPSKSGSYYFSQGCFELIDHLLKRALHANIPLMLGCKVGSIAFDAKTKTPFLHTTHGVISTSKIVVTPGSSLAIQPSNAQGTPRKFYHLYLLTQDPGPIRFSYRNGSSKGVSRMMNLSSCVGLENTGRQLIVFQTYSEEQFQNPQQLLDDLKKAKLVDPNAYILKTDTYIYEQGPYFQIGRLPPAHHAFFEQLNTSHFNIIARYAPKWETLLKPYAELNINN